MHKEWPRLSSDTRLLGLLALIGSQVDPWSQAELMLATRESSRALQAWTDELVAATGDERAESDRVDAEGEAGGSDGERVA